MWCVLQEVDNLGRPADYEYQSKPVYGPFFPSGRGGSPDVMLKGQAQDLNTQLTKQLSTDWPKSFLQVSSIHPMHVIGTTALGLLLSGCVPEPNEIGALHLCCLFP